MNQKLIDFKKYIIGKKIAVVGVGISNMPLIVYLAKLGIDITAFDSQTEEKLSDSIKKLSEYNIKFVLGEDYLEKLKNFDIIFKTPIIRHDIPELEQARSDGSIITSEMEVFFDLCPAKIFAVTGSDGKTTTTTLIYNILKEEGYNCWLGGNIGTPLLDQIDNINDSDMVIMELSSFQLQTMKKSANISVITNLSPNHLDVHKSYDEYLEAKKNIYKFQSKEDNLILNYDNIVTRKLKNEAFGNVIYFSRKEELIEGFYIQNDMIIHKKGEIETEIISKDQIKINGDYNLENFLAAISATYDYASKESIRKVANLFNGVEHRNEFVRTVNGISFYNDSIASSPGRTSATLSAYEDKVILIAGGKDKKIPYDELGKVITDKVKFLVLIGQTSDLIEKSYMKHLESACIYESIPIYKASTYNEAVGISYKNANRGDIIILSPASTSFDMFKNFEERGKVFKKIVMDL